MSSKIYVASSWRNPYQPMIVTLLRKKHQVYDFRDPDSHFTWNQIDPNWQEWNNSQYIEGLDHPFAVAGYQIDYQAMQWADTFVLVMPCGRSAHLEAGWAVGASKRLAILLDHNLPVEPELMYKMADLITDELHILTNWVDNSLSVVL